MVLGAVLAVAVASVFVLWGPVKRRANETLPWQIVVHDGTSSVSGLTLDQSTLGDAAKRFGHPQEWATVAGPGETGSLEAYYSEASMGPVSGKLVVRADVDAATLARLHKDAVHVQKMDSSLRFTLAPQDRALAEHAPISGITFIPSDHFDEATAIARFGHPTERLRIDAHTEHLLYPDKGLDVVLNDNNKNVLQYVAPRDFARVRDPAERAAHQHQ